MVITHHNYLNKEEKEKEKKRRKNRRHNITLGKMSSPVVN